MSKILKYILFTTVLVIITLHSIVSHPHSDELTKEKHLELHKRSNSLIGIIKLLFHESNDENIDNLIFVQNGSIEKTILKKDHFKTFILHDFHFKVRYKNKLKKINIESVCLNSSYNKSRKSRAPPFS